MATNFLTRQAETPTRKREEETPGFTELKIPGSRGGSSSAVGTRATVTPSAQPSTSQLTRGVAARGPTIAFAPSEADLSQAHQFRKAGIESRIQQQDQLDALRAEQEGRGIGTSLVRQQLQTGQEAAGRQALALAASGRGGNVGMAGRQAQVGQAAGAQAAAGQAATLQAQQQLGAQEQLTGAIQQQRIQDLQAQGLDAQTAFEQAQLETQQQEIAAGIELSRFELESEVASRKREQNLGLVSGILGGGGQAAGGIAALFSSDIRNKTDITEGKGDTQDFLDSLDPKSFRRGREPIRRTSIMAQDLERTPAGAAAVIDTPGGKQVDAAELTGTQLAALGQLNDRLKSLEQIFEQGQTRAKIEQRAQPRPQPVPIQRPTPPPPAALQPTPAARQAAGLPPTAQTPPPPAALAPSPVAQQAAGLPPPPPTAPIPIPFETQMAQAPPPANPFEAAAEIEAEEQAEADFLARQAVRRRSMLGGI